LQYPGDSAWRSLAIKAAPIVFMAGSPLAGKAFSPQHCAHLPPILPVDVHEGPMCWRIVDALDFDPQAALV
jgi:hypothetical protein